MSDVEVVMVPRNQTVADLVQACADGKIPFSGPGSLWLEFNQRGWSTQCLYEAVMAAKRLPQETVQSTTKT